MSPRDDEEVPKQSASADPSALAALLAEKSRLLDLILDQMAQGLMLVNADHVVEVCNRRALELLDLPPELMARKPTFIEVLEHQWATDEFAKTPEEIKAFLRGGGILDQPPIYERQRPNGLIIEIQSVSMADGGVLRTYTDITERKRAEEQIRYRARHDGLTSLINRDTFIEILSAKLNECAIVGSRFAVHYMDLDRFKPVNDSLGHAVGDRVLAYVAERIRHAVREGDIVARMGGDEFAMLQPDIDSIEQTIGLGRRVVHSLDAPMDIDGHSISIGLSAGVAIFPAHGVTPEALMRNADRALYDVKCTGGHGVRLFEMSGA